ncbi:MAG TPA: cytochrome c biogenesis heme-transporting ATPase CcmA [Ottowia sp.]|uniref:cytochrome c biogenesis heme-transporting ATPase CcmA n=1 Tax=Ottowia sp. TaxID=1898956 RepID=UPI002C882761|nr:cytochrome c biogenesis heme-transporting ATPase CcmA [Ottowia sp.]HMN22084.1 cytochrome c biogenesis heme-transporting ATPase CcmA [Ottowia sp.]
MAATGPVGAASLQLENLQCTRSGRLLFSGLNATVVPGQLLRVQGANGAGKTSLLRMVCGLLAPQHGRVLWRGLDIARLREEFGRALLYLGHTAALKAELSVLENLQVALALAGWQAAPQAARAALREAGLAGREHAPVRTLSQGQRRRAALARLVLAGATPLWVLDEPFNALDHAAGAWLASRIARHVGAGGIVVLTSHQDVALPAALPQVTLAL